MTMYLCDKCDYEVSGKEELKAHKERDHKRAVIEKIYKCHQCDYEVQGKDKLKIHKQAEQKG